MEERRIDLDSGQSEKNYERRVAHIELMVKLVRSLRLEVSTFDDSNSLSTV